MGREIRRVPIGFDAPIGKVWRGFVNPYPPQKCPTCDGRGMSVDGQRLENFARHVALAAEDSIQRPEGYTPRPRMSFADALFRVRKKLGWNITIVGVGKALKEVMYECEAGLSFGSFLGGLHAMNQGDDPDGPDTSPPNWPFLNLDPAEVFSSITGQVLSDEHAWIIRRLAGIVPAERGFSPRLTSRVWTAGVCTIVLDPKGDRHYPHPTICEDASIGDMGPDFHKVLGAFPGWESSTCNHWDIIVALMTAANVTKEGWYYCQSCSGTGHPNNEAQQIRDAWIPTPVPDGPAYQLWEHVSEGSPQSPAFATPEELANWLAANYDRPQLDVAGWLKFIHAGWAPSVMGVVDGPMMDGVTFVAKQI